MKNKKKNSFRNRIKGFYSESGEYGKNRIKNDEESFDPYEKEDNQNLENPEEKGDLS